jgi:general secretion pathway protein M
VSVLEKLNPRERVLMLGGGAILLVLGLWIYIWQPLMAERSIQTARIARYLTVIELARNAGGAGVPRPTTPVQELPLSPRITQSAEAAGIVLARLDPDGPRLRITVAKAGFADLVAWIASLEAGAGVRMITVEMSRLTEPGQVSLRLLLEDVQ